MKLSIEASIYHSCRVNTDKAFRRIGPGRHGLRGVCVCVCVWVGGWRGGGRHSAGSVFNLHRQVRLLDEMFAFQMNTALPLHCADAAHHVGPIWNYEWWVKLLTDRTGRTCLYAVYTTAAHVCSYFVFSLCGIQNTQTRRSSLWICLYSSSPLFFFFFIPWQIV